MTEDCIASAVFERLQLATAAQPAELAELYHDYLTEGRQTLQQLHEAVLNRQPEDLRYQAHYLKGSSLIMGATAVARHCVALEGLGGTGDWNEAERLLVEIAADLEALEIAVNDKLGAIRSANGSAA